MTVLEFLQSRRGTLRVISEATGLSRRAVEMEIQRLRLEGLPVVTNGDGAWLGTAEEVAECADRLRHRYVTQAVTARALRRTARRLAEKQDLVLWDAA